MSLQKLAQKAHFWNYTFEFAMDFHLLTNLKAGEEIITSGGIIGKVKNVSESFVTLETGPNSTMKVIKENISSLTKGKTDKTKSDKTKSDKTKS